MLDVMFMRSQVKSLPRGSQPALSEAILCCNDRRVGSMQCGKAGARNISSGRAETVLPANFFKNQANSSKN